ncbi:MAG: ribonuclease Z [Nanoarchaeota archaeon]|nr:ribonuclease Z [Nanoarchaeota archaeon]
MKIEITFLGTGSAIPTAKRNHTAILINYGAENILIDCGEGTQRQFKIAKLNPCKLTRILLTHWHADHALGIPGLLKTLDMSDYSKTLYIYGPKGTKEKIRLLEKIYGKFRINPEIHEVSSGILIDEKEFLIETKPVPHKMPTNAYALIIKDKLRLRKDILKKLKLPSSPLLGKLQQGKDVTFKGKKLKAKNMTYLQKGKKITFVLDSAMSNNSIKLAKNSDILICESSYSSKEEEKAREYCHLTAKQAATIAKKAKVKKLILTHLSHKNEHNTKLILDEAKKVFKATHVAKDFDKIIV